MKKPLQKALLYSILIHILLLPKLAYTQNYPPILDKNSLTGEKGITFPNVDLEGSNSFGSDVHFIGDINNDGLEDIAISSDYAVINGNDFTGRAYIVFGTEDEFDATFDLNSLNGDNGFVVEGVAEYERRGGINAGVGDINGDGIDDVVIGSDQSRENVIVLYGNNSFPALIKSSDINGNDGFVIAFSGSNSVDGLGDVNGDGINDFIIGTPHWSGRARIVFGRSDDFPSEIDETYLDGIKGFSTSEFPASRASYTVGGAGDINNDGTNDILIGSWNTYSGGPDDEKISFALFGKSESFDPLINITDVDGSDGFLIDNRDNSFISYVGEIGDINGDGIDDCFSENNVIFGSNDPFAPALMRADFDEEIGFLVKDNVSSMAPAGDLNFDDIDDFIIVGSGMLSIVYGSIDGFPVEFDREDIDGTNGFLIDDLSVTGRGIDGGKDFNGDGKADFIFTDRTYDDRNVYLVFGGDHYAIPFHDDYPKIEDITTDGFSINVNAQEKGKVNFAIFESSTYYSVNYEAINSGSDAVMHGEFPVNTANTEVIKLIEGLKSSTNYDVHLYFEDEADNIGDIYSFEDVKTLFDPATAFVTTWDTENEGDTDDDQIKLIVSGGRYDIHWENLADPSINGVIEDAAGTTTITFPEAGQYKIALPNSISRFFFNFHSTDAKKLLTVEQWGNAQWQSMEDMFYGCSNLTIPADDIPDLSEVTSMNYMFYQASSFNSDINDWDVSNVTDFSSLFTFAHSFNQDLNNWDVSNATTMRSTFYGASSFNSDISDWDVSNVTDMYFMFSDATAFNQDIGDWDVSNVTKMGCLFRSSAFNQDIGDWDVSNVTIMNEMFRKASDFNQDISGWDVGQNTTMYFMFSEASSFNQDIGSWDVSNVENMYSTFRDSPAFDQNLGDWDISKVENLRMFLWDSGLSPCNYSATLEGWSKLDLQDDLTFHAGNSKYTTEAEVFRQTIIDDFNWSIRDRGELTNEVTISIDQEVSCPGASDAILKGASSISGVDFKWYNEENELIGEDALLKNLEAGTYMLKVEATSDCFFTQEITIPDGVDDESPEITCPEDQSLTPGSNLPDYTSLAIVTDNCDADVTVSQSPAIGTEFTEEITVTLTAEDSNGNTETCTFTVEASPDTEAPVISCPEDQNLACDVTEIPDFTDLVSATDNRDSEPTIAQSPAVGSTFTDGMTIIMTAEDAAGNTSTCEFEVSRSEDDESPEISCPEDQQLDPGDNLPDYTSLATVTDNCDTDVTISQSPAVGTEFTEEIIVTLIAEDANGNEETCTFTVEVSPDTEAPEINCPADQSLGCDVTEIPDFTDLVSATDNRDSEPTISQSPAVGSTFTDGMTITMTAEDASGNTSTCEFEVSRLEDSESPEITCPEDQQLDPGDNLPDYTSLATVTDNCDADVIVSQSPAVGTEFTEETTVILTAEDANGNRESCTFTVEVSPDTEAPEINCPVDQSLGCDVTKIPDFTDLVSATDTRDPEPTISQSPAVGSTFTDGMTITMTAEDASGNSSTCEFIIQRDEDTESPSISCLAPQTLTIGQELPDYTEIVDVDDNCGGDIVVTQSVEAGTEVTNDFIVTITAEDENGNFSDCEIEIFAVAEPDTEAPQLTCLSDQTQSCDQNTIIDYTALVDVNDNRDPKPVITQSPEAGASFTDGMTITITATDNSGNASTCEFTLSSVDTEAPEITCLDTQNLEEGELLPDYSSMISFIDNCDDNPKITQSPEAGTKVSEDLEVAIKVEDKNGNITTCSFQIEVEPSSEDTEAPEISCPANQTIACDISEIPDYTDLVEVTDNKDSNPTITQSPVAGSDFTEGMIITMTAEDASGNSTSCTFEAKSEDTSPVSFFCPEPQVISMSENCEAIVPDFSDLINVEEGCVKIESISQTPEIGTAVFEDTEVNIKVIDENGEESSCRFNLKVEGYGFPTVEVEALPEINVGESVELNAKASSEGSYRWFPSLGLNNPNIANPIASPEESTTYTVIFTNNFGCSVEDEVTVFVNEGIQVAKGFSPDHDGINDLWIIGGIEEYQNNEVFIYNRWGNVVYAMSGYDNQHKVFEGIANRNTNIGGGELPEGTYFYKINLRDNKGTHLEGFLVLKK